MFARIVEVIPKMEMLDRKEEVLRILKNEVAPIMRKQRGFMEFIPQTPKIKKREIRRHYSLGGEERRGAL
jgi:hypothetical protein